MKIYYKTSKRWLAGVAAVSLLAITLSACTKSQNVIINTPVALVSFTQASPDEPALDFALDNNQVNLNPLGYLDHIDYVKAYTGQRTITIVNHTTGAKVLTDTATVAANVPYSIFLANKASSPELLVLTDSISNPGTTKATVRFINLSPDATAVDFAIKGSTVLATNKKYKSYTSYLPLTGNQSYTFQMLQTGTSTVLATLTNLTLSNGFVYTIYLSGTASATTTTDQLTATSIVNAVYY